MTLHPSFGSAEVAEAVARRRRRHTVPELAFEEHATQRFVAERLASFGLAVSPSLAGTEGVGTLKRRASLRSVALRADMDAMPIAEATGAAYASIRPGRMRACSHDGHMAMLLAAGDPAVEGMVHLYSSRRRRTRAAHRRPDRPKRMVRRNPLLQPDV